MIERSEFIESVNTWYRNPMAISNDAMMAALVTLRIASADILEAFNPQRPAPSMIQAYRFDSLLKTHSIQIDAWKNHWVEITSEKGKCSLPKGCSGQDVADDGDRALPPIPRFFLWYPSIFATVLIQASGFYSIAIGGITGRYRGFLDHLHQCLGNASTGVAAVSYGTSEFCARLDPHDDRLCSGISHKVSCYEPDRHLSSRHIAQNDAG